MGLFSSCSSFIELLPQPLESYLTLSIGGCGFRKTKRPAWDELFINEQAAFCITIDWPDLTISSVIDCHTPTVNVYYSMIDMLMNVGDFPFQILQGRWEKFCRPLPMYVFFAGPSPHVLFFHRSSSHIWLSAYDSEVSCAMQILGRIESIEIEIQANKFMWWFYKRLTKFSDDSIYFSVGISNSSPTLSQSYPWVTIPIGFTFKYCVMICSSALNSAMVVL